MARSDRRSAAALSMSLLAALSGAGCVPPSTIGVLTDGELAAPGEIAITGAGGGYASPGEEGGWLAGGGAGVEVGVTERVTAQAHGAALRSGGDAPGAEARVVVGGEARVGLRPASEPWQLTALGGVGTYRLDTLGTHAGLVASRPLPSGLRPYAGLKVNPVWLPEGGALGAPTIFWDLGAGASWRVGEGGPLRIGLEASAVTDELLEGVAVSGAGWARLSL